MRWRKVSDYCIELEEFRIIKVIILSKERFHLYRSGEHVMSTADPDAAKRKARAMRNQDYRHGEN